MTINQMLMSMDSYELSEWIAFDMLKDDDFKQQLESEAMDEDQRNAAIKAMLGG